MFLGNFVKRLGQVMDVSAIQMKYYYYYYYYYYYFLFPITEQIPLYSTERFKQRSLLFPQII